jgi:uncharacterized protein YegL
MNDNLTEIAAILDRSGSMEHLTDDTIGGYNSFIKEQREQPGEARLTTVLFDDQYELLHDRVNIKKMKPITRREYSARGMTALLDALGKTINDIGAKLRDTPEPERPGKVIFFIITDGMENASKEFSNEKVKEMVELQKNTYNWEFIFVGADIDAFDAARSIGINADRAFNVYACPEGIINAQAASSLTLTKTPEYTASPRSWRQTVPKQAVTHQTAGRKLSWVRRSTTNCKRPAWRTSERAGSEGTAVIST